MRREFVASRLVPQADRLERVYAYLRSIQTGDPERVEAEFPQPRDRAYIHQAAEILGLVDGKRLTAAGRRIAASELSQAYRFLAQAFANSVIGKAWLWWARATGLGELRPEDAARFLSDCTELSESTRNRRAQTLASWLKDLQRFAHAQSLPPVGVLDAPGEQLSLVAGATSVGAPEPLADAHSWPPPERFPHNEESSKVEKVIEQDIECSSDVLLIAGYSALDRLVALLETRAAGQGQVRLLLGSEPFPSQRASFGSSVDFHSEVRDYWYRRGVSVHLSGAILHARELVASKTARVRTYPGPRKLHAKVYATDRAITLGSSNFTHSGLRYQAEANVRFTAEEAARHAEARALAEKLWEAGRDDDEWFLELLDGLLRTVGWEEALGRACAELLDGEWVQRYVPPPDDAARKLWLHQRQGISQAIWILQNVGSVLVADPTGSGKTRMGSWIIRGAFDHHYRRGFLHDPSPLVIVPPQVVENWVEALNSTGLPLQVQSHGHLSSKRASRNQEILGQIERTALVAVDEAHNFIRDSERGKALRLHYAENVVLFTATPINRGPRDLFAIMELLGADQLDERAYETLVELGKYERLGKERRAEVVLAARNAIRQFTVRRTRRQLDEIARAHPEEYRIGDRSARYPKHRAQYFDCRSKPEDDRIADEIHALASRLHGVARLGERLKAPKWLPEEQYLRRVVASARALARYHVMASLRSSRVALYEHAVGADRAWKHFLGEAPRKGKRDDAGNFVERSLERADRPPRWKLSIRPPDEFAWLLDPREFARRAEEDAVTYEHIAELTTQLSDSRERSKLDHLERCCDEAGLVIAFDSYLVSLRYLEAKLRERGVYVEVLTGELGLAGKRRAVQQLGRETNVSRLVALCTDAFSEGLNLQGASCVVHLDTPTVVRVAEQRAGRVDRMDSPHDEVTIWWPRDAPAFAPRGRDVFRERHRVVQDLLGANVLHPDDDDAEAEHSLPSEALDRSLSPEELVQELEKRRQKIEEAESVFDAFQEVRRLVEGNEPLVSASVYEAMRRTQAEIVACVSVLESETPWCFLALGGLDRAAPRWVYFDGLDAPPVFDLDRIPKRLRERLGTNPPSRRADEESSRLLKEFLDRLRQCEERFELLPARKRRALKLLRSQLRRLDTDRAPELWQLDGELFPKDRKSPYPDPASIADAWIRHLRPLIRSALANRRRNARPWRIDDLGRTEELKQALDPDKLRRIFRDVPLLRPVDERIVALIVGVPTPRRSLGQDQSPIG